MRMANKRLKKKTGRREGVMKAIYSGKQSRGMVAKLRNRRKYGHRVTTALRAQMLRNEQSWAASNERLSRSDCG
jgi:hypothetical protein